MKKFLKVAFCVVLALLVLGFGFSFLAPSSDPVPDPDTYVVYTTPSGVEKHIYTDSEEYYKRAQDLIAEREKQYTKSCLRSSSVAHAAEKSPYYDELIDNTRFNDRWLNGNYLTGIDVGLDLILNTMEIQSGGQNPNELVIHPFYEITGKIGVHYNKFIDGEWRTLLTEVITAYAPFVPAASNNYGSYMVNPPDFPQWSLRGIQPNEICYMRELETGDINYFIYHPAGSSNQCNGTWLNTTDKYGSPISGTRFDFDTRSVYIEDGTGRHDFYVNGDYASFYFVTNEVNTIFTGYGDVTFESWDAVNFYQNATIARNFTWFYTSYLITNADEHDTSVVNPNQVNNNWEFNQYPVYRFTNNYFTSTYNTQDYHNNHYLDQTTINDYSDMGLTYDSNTNKFDLDPTLLAGAVAGALVPELQGAFEGVFSLQPDIGLPFNSTNNNKNYIDLIVEDDSGGGSWSPPDYPAVNTSVYIPANIPTYSTYAAQTMPASYIDGAGDWLFAGYDIFDSLGLLVVIIPLVILGLFWRFTGGD